MSKTAQPAASPDAAPARTDSTAWTQRLGWLLAACIAMTIAAYSRTWSVPFLFDDLPSIPQNPTIRHLGQALFPPPNLTVTGRPLLNLSLALNHLVSGERVWSYHVLNLLIHLAAGLTLFGVLRRGLAAAAPGGPVRSDARILALIVTAWWLLHPLQTESVTYVIQRAEALAGLFYLLTLYGFMRMTANADHDLRWGTVSVLACFAGMATKEVGVSAPLLVLLYDRTFVAGSFRAAWTRRRRYYVALASAWLLLGLLIAGTDSRGGSVGFETDVGVWEYLLTQSRALVLYLQLTVWPTPQVLDYGKETVALLSEVWPFALVVMALLVATGWALVRRPHWGFVGAWFFALLAPSSSFVPIATQTIAEHRMYLPLVAPLLVLGLALAAAAGRHLRLAGALAAAGLAAVTFARNETYRTDLGIWADTVAKRPSNARAHYNLAVSLEAAGRLAESKAHFLESLRLEPDFVEPRNNLGVALMREGRLADAIVQYRVALQYDPDSAETHNNLGRALAQSGEWEQALAHYETALKLRPTYPAAFNNRGEALAHFGHEQEALESFRRARELWPEYPEAHNNLANILLTRGQLVEAIAEYELALAAKPAFPEALGNLGLALLQVGRPAEAMRRYEELLALEPDDVSAHNNLGYLHHQAGNRAAAISHYEQALRLDPANAHASAALRLLRGER